MEIKQKNNIFKKFRIDLQIIYLVLGYFGLSVLASIVSIMVAPLYEMTSSELTDALHLFFTYLLTVLIMVLIAAFSKPFVDYIKRIVKLKEGFFEGIAIGAATFACATLYSLFVSLIFGDIGSNDNQESLNTSFEAQPLLIFLCVVVFAPITEELTYRYGLFGLLSRKSKIVGYIFTTLIFALIHFNFLSNDLIKEIILLPSYLIGAIWLTYAFSRKGNIITSIVAHSTYNFSQYILMFISTFILKQ